MVVFNVYIPLYDGSIDVENVGYRIEYFEMYFTPYEHPYNDS